MEESYLKLPIELYLIVRGYVGNKEWFNFLCCGKKLSGVKKETAYYRLNRIFSVQFYENTDGFRDLLLSLVMKSSKQIALTLEFHPNLIDLSVLGTVHSVRLAYCAAIINVKALTSVASLTLQGCNNLEEDISDQIALLIAENSLESLEISNNDSNQFNLEIFSTIPYLKIDKCHGLQNLEALSSMHQHLDLSSCSQITDLNFLNYSKFQKPKVNLSDALLLKRRDYSLLHTLKLSKCENLVDISAISTLYQSQLTNRSTDAFSNTNCAIHTLDLSFCENLLDISPLANIPIRFLNLSNCSQFEDVAPVGNHVHSINLSNCANLLTVDSLVSVKKINLTNCKRLQAVNMLGQAEELILTNCHSIANIDCLQHVPILILTRCYQITDLTAFMPAVSQVEMESLRATNANIPYHNEFIDLRQCSGVTDVTPLTFVKKLYLAACSNITDISMLQFVVELNISYNSQITTIPNLPCCEKLDISYCRTIRYLSQPQSTEVVADTATASFTGNIAACISSSGAKRLPNLPRLKVLIMYGCDSIRDLRSLADDVQIKHKYFRR